MGQVVNPPLLVAAVALILTISAPVLYTAFMAPPVLTGTVEAKAATGMVGQQSRTIVTAHRGYVNVEDPRFRDEFKNASHVTVNDSVASKLDGRYRC
ncbi:MAG: hypothetical protein ABEK12_02585 [Candidatus Nanohaloarchaea archaeon]